MLTFAFAVKQLNVSENSCFRNIISSANPLTQPPEKLKNYSNIQYGSQTKGI